MDDSLVLWLQDIESKDTDKCSNLGEMYQHLTERGVSVPNGFAITVSAYRFFLDENQALGKLNELQAKMGSSESDVREAGKEIRRFVKSLVLPEKLVSEISSAYQKLCDEFEADTDVAVRSSATAEDLPTASFAGQLNSYLNVRGKEGLMLTVKKCFASLFTERAIIYRRSQNIDFHDVGISVCVQKMVRSDLAASGVMFTIDTESGNPGVIVINSAYGLGENVVQGSVNPDEFRVFKETLNKKPKNSDEFFRPIISKTVGTKALRMVYEGVGSSKTIKNIPVPKDLRKNFSLTDDEVLQLARWGLEIECHYSEIHGKSTPMDIEWAKDGKSGKLFIVQVACISISFSTFQARSETVHAQASSTVYHKYSINSKEAANATVLVTGSAVGSRIGQGKVCIIRNISHISDFVPGCVLVTEQTDPDWASIMSQASAIVTDCGGRTCHAAIVSRELGIPCLVGTGTGTKSIRNGSEVTVDCSHGFKGCVYQGLVPFDVKEIDLSTVPETKTKMMMIVGDPEKSFEFSRIPNQGVGLVRIEFVISEYIKVHPLALVHYDKFGTTGSNEEEEKELRKVKHTIDKLTRGYKNKPDYFIDKLAQGIAQIASAFYPKEVIVRMSDFKTNEYANLLGGKDFEPMEENPMLGWRGASRYYDKKYESGFALECAAIRKLREEFGLDNVVIMIPFCRTVEEAELVMRAMERNCISKKDGWKIYAMCEIPSNVLLANEFLRDDLFDGFSIGSNDLTQLTLGLDRDSGLLSHIGNELNPAVKKLISMAITTANERGKYIGICGQGPSDFPEFAQWLVRENISSISLNPDCMLETLLVVAKEEKEMQKKLAT